MAEPITMETQLPQQPDCVCGNGADMKAEMIPAMDTRAERLVSFFRSSKMTSRERDLVSQADDMLNGLFGGKMTEAERVTLETWLSGKLDQERQGWKQKLQLSMKEIEKQRKLAMEAHSTVEEINQRVETMFSPVLALYREPSAYHPDDKALSRADKDNLERNLTTIQQTIQTLERERVEVREHFQIPAEISLVEFIADLRDGARREEGQALAEATETEARLRREINNLNEAFELRENISKTEKEAFNLELSAQKQEIAELTEIIQRLKLRIRSDGRVKLETREVQVRILPAQRECCIQVDLSTRPDRGAADGTAEKPDLEKKTATEDCKDRRHALATRRSLQSIDTSHTDSSKSLDTTLSKPGDAKARDTPFLPRDKKIPYLTDSNYSLLHVRNQVVTLANKLEKAKWDMESYEQKLAAFRMHPKNSPNEYAVRKSQAKAGNSIESGRKWASSDGFLAGNGAKPGKDKRTTDLGDIKENKLKSRVSHCDEARKTSGSSLSMRCLRCDRNYTGRDNNKVACRYHPKGKQTIEKYDSTGKLQKVIMIWECCMQKETSVGCSVGQHI